MADILGSDDPRLTDARAPLTHGHVISDITGLQDALDAAGGGTPPQVFIQTSNISTGANVTPVSVPGFVFNFEANSVYVVDLYMLTQAPAATTGHGFQFDTSVAVSLNMVTFYHQLANAGTLTGGSAIADDASVGVSSGQATANVPVLNHGAAILVTGAATGTAQLRFRSEVAAVATCVVGSVMKVTKVG